MNDGPEIPAVTRPIWALVRFGLVILTLRALWSLLHPQERLLSLHSPLEPERPDKRTWRPPSPNRTRQFRFCLSPTASFPSIRPPRTSTPRAICRRGFLNFFRRFTPRSRFASARLSLAANTLSPKPTPASCPISCPLPLQP